MYGYSDYFDIKKKNRAYGRAEDDLKDHLAALDLLLECFIHYKAEKQDISEWHVRGIEPDETEISTYFKEAPQKRPWDVRAAAVSKEMKKALEHIRCREEATLKTGGEVPVRHLAEEYALGIGGVFMLLMAASVRYDLKYLRIYAFISGEKAVKSISAGVADAVLNFFLPGNIGSLEEYLAPDGVLRRCLIEAYDEDEDKAMPPLKQKLILNEYVYRYMLMGRSGLKISPLPVKAVVSYYPELEEKIVYDDPSGRAGAFIRYVESRDSEDVIYVLGCAARRMGCPLYIFRAGEMAECSSSRRKSMLFTARILPGIVLLIHEKAVSEDERLRRKFRDELNSSVRTLSGALPGRIIYVCGQERIAEMDLPADMAPALISLALPAAMMRIRMWHECLKNEAIVCSENIDIDDIADCHELSYSAIRRLCRQAKESMNALGRDELSRELLQELLFKLDTSDFEHLATEVKARYTWDDIYIEASQKRRLQAACDRYRLRGRIGDKWGISKKNAYGNAVILLMYGPPGTGKTMAAQAIANEVMTPLYRVDVSQIFSKYIGETQKNLSRIFDEASRRSVVLFFDEADALFTRRTEIKDSHDKYANSDTSFLLQKVEEYNGISILATNNFQSFDPAFMRRLSYVVRFERPDEDTRRAMWENMLPKDVPMAADVDYEFLASRFKELTGSNIKSILLTAAYLAGAQSRPVGMRDIILATRYEFEKLGRLIDSDEFGRYAVFMQE